jgi:beta-galactosidase
MGLGIVGRLASHIDIAVIDYNFYDGYTIRPDAWKMPVMVDYARHLGYRQVYAGFYIERWRSPVGVPGSPVDPSIFRVIAQSVFECRSRGLIDGIEIGGFGNMRRDVRMLASPMMRAATGEVRRRQSAPGSLRVGLFASHATFDWFVGENAHGHNVHGETLTRSYELLCSQTDFEAVVISEHTLETRPDVIDSLDVIYVPHQPVVTDAAVFRLAAFAHDRMLVQDVRCGEWGDDGHYRDGWCNDLFGIATIAWRNGGGFKIGDREVAFPQAVSGDASHALLAARSSAPAILSTEFEGMGLVIRQGNAITLGFVPALVAGAEGEVWRHIFFGVLAGARRSGEAI